jgi:iron(III) transport system substrate-binding protein
MKTRHWLLLCLSLSIILVAAGCGGGDKPAQTPAKTETINIYTIWPEKYSSAVFAAFTKETGVKVNFLRFSSGEALARIVAEKDNPQVDVLFGGPADTFAAGVEKGVFEPYAPKGADKIPAKFKDPMNFWVGVAINPICFMFNNKFLKEKNIPVPTSWDELLNPAFKNNLQMADARTSGTAISRILSLTGIMGEDKAYEYQKKLHPNVQMYTKSGAGGALHIANGQTAGGVFFLVDTLEIKQQGHDVVISYPKEGVAYAVEAMAMINKAKQPALAKKFLDWASTADMQKLYESSKINFLPTSPDVKVTDPALDVSKVKFVEVDIQKAGKDRQRLVDRWINEVIK